MTSFVTFSIMLLLKKSKFIQIGDRIQTNKINNVYIYI